MVKNDSLSYRRDLSDKGIIEEIEYMCLSNGERYGIEDESVLVENGQLVVAPLGFPE